MADEEFKHEIDATKLTPGELWVTCQQLTPEQFPCRVQFKRDGAFLRSERDAKLFGIGVHFGSMVQEHFFE